MGPLAIFAVVAVVLVISLALLGFALVVARNGSQPRPALPVNCGDCVFMVPRAKVYRRETIEGRSRKGAALSLKTLPLRSKVG